MQRQTVAHVEKSIVEMDTVPPAVQKHHTVQVRIKEGWVYR